MSETVRFHELRVHRMPGFEDGGFRLEELAGGINLIRGPNASGKTTAARALQRLLWPGSGHDRAWVEGRLTVGGGSWRVEVDGTRVAWERDGEPARAPALPGSTSRHRYLLSLTDLLEADDRDLAELIRVESAGGYDVSGAARELGFGAGGFPQSRVRALRDARGSLEDANVQTSRLREDRARLAGLEAQRLELHRQAAFARALEDAIRLSRARESVAAAERALSVFPSAVASLRGNEVEQLEEWAGREESLRSDLTAASTRAEAAERDLQRADLGEDGVASSTLIALEKRLDGVKAADAAIESDRRALDEARARRRLAGGALGIPDDAEPPAFAGSDTARLDSFIDRAQRVRAERADLDARLRILDEGAAEDGRDETLDDGLRILRSWLRAAPAGAAGSRWARLVTGSIVVFAALAVLLASSSVVWPPALAIAALPAIAAAVLLLRRPSRGADPRADLEAEARRIGHDPDAWTEDAVRDHLDGLEQRAARLRAEELRRQERERVADARRALAEEESMLEAERAGLASSLGLDLGIDDLTLTLSAARLRQWDDARGTESAAEARLEATRNGRRSALDEAAAMLSGYGYDPDDAETLAGALDELRDRRSAHEQARTSLDTARRDRDRAEAELASLAERRAGLVERVGVDGERAVRDLVDLRDDYLAAVDALKTSRRDLDAAGSSLREAVERALVVAEPGTGPGEVRGAGRRGEPTAMVTEELAAELAAVAPEDLARRLDEARVAAGRERDVADEIARIRDRLERARTRHDVEDALAAVDAARSELEAQRDTDVDDAIGAALVEWLEASSSESNRPAVFHRARELLTLITRGHFRLDLASDGAEFRAYDTVAARGRSLDELSAGTRIQLLLAVRVAFVETQEQGAAPPLLLDEVLANCDDVRAAAIIDAAIVLARAGRQVFYFTAQADELGKWRDALREQYDVEWAERELADAAPVARAFDWAGRAPDRQTVPTPDGRDHAAYGAALRVPPFDPWRDTAAVHLWYLVDDVDTLHELLALGIDRWGKLQHFARHGGAELHVVGSALEDARRAAELCEHFAALWRRGRGRPLDRRALAESGAITDTFLDRVTDLCHDLDGNADAVLEALEGGVVPRFRSASVEELREYCRRNGHISEDPPMDDEGVRLALVAAAAGAGPTAVDRLIDRLCHGPRDAVAAGDGEPT